MEAYVSPTTADMSTRRWKSMVIFLLIIITSQEVECQRLTIEESPKNATVGVGESVTLKCVFNRPVDCSWLKDDKAYRIKSKDGNYFIGESSTGEGTRDCSIRISNVTEDDFAKWRCSSWSSKGVETVSSQNIWIIKRDPPPVPIILFNNEEVSEIDLPSADPPSHMVCVSPKGNPPPQLHWEVNGTRYLGRTESVKTDPNLAINQLRWDRGGGWHVFDNVEEIVCRANHPGHANETFARVEFKRHYAPGIMKILVKRFNDSSVTIGSHDVVIFSCISDGGHRNGQWELWSERDRTWKLYNNSHEEHNSSVTSDRVGQYRCMASNQLNKDPTTTTSTDLFTVVNSNGTAVSPANGSVGQLTTADGRSSDGLGSAAIMAIILGITQFITLVILARFVIQKRSLTLPHRLH